MAHHSMTDLVAAGLLAIGAIVWLTRRNGRRRTGVPLPVAGPAEPDRSVGVPTFVIPATLAAPPAPAVRRKNAARGSRSHSAGRPPIAALAAAPSLTVRTPMLPISTTGARAPMHALSALNPVPPISERSPLNRRNAS